MERRLLTRENEASLSAYMGKTSVRRDEEAEKHCFPVSPFTYLLRDASFDSFLRLFFSLSRATTTRRILSNGSSRLAIY